MKGSRHKPSPSIEAPCSPPKPIPLKYCETALVPFELLEGDSPSQIYHLASGETVAFTYLSGIDNGDMSQQERLERESMLVHGMSYESIQKAWERRIGRISDVWYKVRMTLLTKSQRA